MTLQHDDYRLTFGDLRDALVSRLATYRNANGRLEDCADWTPNDWCTAVMGELGEAANILKKVRRGDMTMDEARPKLAKEFGDVQAYLDHLTRCCGVDLGEATRSKFNEISERIGSPVRLPRPVDVLRAFVADRQGPWTDDEIRTVGGMPYEHSAAGTIRHM